MGEGPGPVPWLGAVPVACLLTLTAELPAAERPQGPARLSTSHHVRYGNPQTVSSPVRTHREAGIEPLLPEGLFSF